MPICRSSLGIIIISISFHLVVVVVGGLVCSCSSASSEMKSKKKKRREREKRTSLTWRCALRVSLDAGGDSGSHHPLTIACGGVCVVASSIRHSQSHTHSQRELYLLGVTLQVMMMPLVGDVVVVKVSQCTSALRCMCVIAGDCANYEGDETLKIVVTMLRERERERTPFVSGGKERKIVVAVFVVVVGECISD